MPTGALPDASRDRSHEPEQLALLRRVAEVSAASGLELAERVVELLVELCGASHALLAESVDEARMRSLALRGPGGLEAQVEWELAGTPCAEDAREGVWRYPSGAALRFPRDPLLVQRRIEGFHGAPLHAPDGRRLGMLAVFDARPLALDARLGELFRVLAARAAAELARLSVARTLRESEERYRDLFDEAPIAYVHEDLETRFLRANRAALRTLGLKPEEVVGTRGMSFIPDTPEAQRRVREAFESVERGTDTAGVVLELRRKDDGRPLWIQWWSKPDPSGAYTRTMFVDITERVLMEREQARLREQNRYLREELKSVHDFGAIVGCSAGLREVLESVRKVAPTEATVLITGETGTGKELVARAIHSASRRHDKPLIKLSCAALPTGLVESELFGHERGAFSGAIARRIGRFELAQGGTIFLDEVGEVPLDVQVKLLRVLQEREFERVGGSEPIQADVRVIAATNRDLPRAVAEGRFRSDLFYRLNVFPIRLPALRERASDVPLLARFFLEKSAARVGKQVEGFSAELLGRFQRYPWPGNVRELENVVERAVILAAGPLLDAGSAPLLPEGGELAPDAPAAPEASLESVEREHVRAVLERCAWVVEGPAGAARLLGLRPSTLRSRMKKLGLARAARGAS